MINGGFKFFDKNLALSREGATAVASSGDDIVKAILDISRYTQWESIGSNDVTTETITVTLKSAKTFNRLLLVDMNFKQFNIKYHNGVSFVDFSNVIGVNGVTSSTVNETTFSYDTAYYEFDEVTSNQIQIVCDTTQIANAQKFLTQLIVTAEIGTLEGFPRAMPSANRNETKAKTLSRRLVVQKTYETNKIKMTFKTHPHQNDLDILETLFDREESFLVYPCGARTGTDYFKLEQKSWRLKDIFNMQMLGAIKNEWEKGVYLIGFNKSITFEEHV